MVGSLVIGFVACLAFLVVEGRVPEPMMPLDLFRLRDFAGANAFTLLFYFALGGKLFSCLSTSSGFRATPPPPPEPP